MSYRRTASIGGNGQPAARLMESARALCWSPDGYWYLAGDQEILAFDSAGAFQRRWSTGLPALSLTLDPQDRIWAGQQGQIELFSRQGELLETWRNPEDFGWITAIAVTEGDLYLADARSRWIHRYDADRALINHIGDRHRKGGFHIPNGVLDFAVDLDETVVVANPGMHRVERYKPNGESLGYFGRFGQHDPEGFPGCCNPTNLAVGPDGEIVVSEKAGPRVKVYDPEGHLIAVVADGDAFDPACKNMDLAVTRTGVIGVVDPVGRQIVTFEGTTAVAETLTTSGDSA